VKGASAVLDALFQEEEECRKERGHAQVFLKAYAREKGTRGLFERFQQGTREPFRLIKS
jgi:hypothetical protein